MFPSASPPHRPGLLAGCLLLLSAYSAFTADPDPLASSKVVINYGELSRLIEQAAAPKPATPPGPPLPACLTRASYRLRFEQDQPRLEAAFTVENLADAWACLPLGEAAATLPDPPAGLRLARHQGGLALVLEKAGRADFQLQLLPAADGVFEWSPPAEAALASLEIDAPPPELAVQITWPDGRTSRHEQALAAGLNPGKKPLRLALIRRDAEAPAGPHALDAAIVTEAAFQTQTARDGAQLTTASLRVEHAAAASLRLHLPPGAELLRGAVGGRPLPAETAGPDGSLLIPLPAPAASEETSAATEITLAYFAQGDALHPSEGELDLLLPRTPLLIRRLEWSIELPEGLQLTAQGNAEIRPASAPAGNVLHLERRLCRDNATQIRLTYRRPNPAN